MTEVFSKTVTAHQLGWLKRSELGKNVWEKPNGELYKHYSDREPVFEILKNRYWRMPPPEKV